VLGDPPISRMVDPKNYREVAIDLEAFKREVEPRFTHLNTLVYWILAVIVGAAASGGFAIYKLTGDIEKNLAGLSQNVVDLSKTVSDLSDRVKAHDQRVVREPNLQPLLDELRRMGSVLQAVRPANPDRLALSSDERNIILSFLAPGPVTGPVEVEIGDRIPTAFLKPIPDNLAAKLPKLKGLSYALSNGTPVIAQANGRVIAIVTGSA
jgi:hypothetical protein